MQLPFIDGEGAWVTYPAGEFAPDFDQVIEIAIHPSTGLLNAPKQFKQLLLDQNPESTDAGFIVAYVNRLNIAGPSYRGFINLYRQTTDGLRSAAGTRAFDSGDTPPFAANALDYNGTTNFGLRGADLTGNADSKICLLSCWFKIDGGDGTFRTIAQNTSARYFLRLDTANRLEAKFDDSAAATVVHLRTSDTYLAGSGWHHVAIAIDTDSDLHQIFVDGAVPALGIDVFNAGTTVDWTTGNHSFGSNPISANLWDGCLSQMYLDNVTTLDLAANNNLRAFRDANGDPEFLGAVGSFPTTTQPILFFPDGDPAANSGTGGNYVNNAALSACVDAP